MTSLLPLDRSTVPRRSSPGRTCLCSAPRPACPGCRRRRRRTRPGAATRSRRRRRARGQTYGRGGGVARANGSQATDLPIRRPAQVGHQECARCPARSSQVSGRVAARGLTQPSATCKGVVRALGHSEVKGNSWTHRRPKLSVSAVTLGTYGPGALPERIAMTSSLRDVMRMRRSQVRRRPTKRPIVPALDLRTPSGRQLPF